MSKKNNIGLVAILVLLICLFSGLLFVLVRRNQTLNEIKENAEWYDETAKEFTLNTAEELYEFKQLSTFRSFKGQTVKLGADIVVNEGNAEEWVKDAPNKKWFPITGFEGTFDGQGHSISGLYGKGTNLAMGLFANTKTKAVIKNFSLLNSYFETKGSIGVGSIASNGGGTFSRIYSDAIINHKGDNASGIVSNMKFQTTVSECWYDGKITMTGRSGGGIVDQLYVVTVQLDHCLFTGEIYSHYNDGGARIGGIVGSLKGTGSNMTITDCLSVGKVGAMQTSYVGSVLGVAYSGGKVVVKDTFGSMATHRKSIASSQGKLEGSSITVHEDKLQGVEAYRWTSLDFDKYWVAQEGATPMLACFSDSSLSLAGIEKGFDTSWYSESGKEFVIDTLEKFYGFAYLSEANTFEGQTIKLAVNISLNDGKASDWAKKAPKNTWNMLNSEKHFYGTFDGQGHTISGLYAVGDNRIGLFGRTARECTIKNLKIKNSYFEGEYQVGSVTGQGAGTFDSIYSDAILVARLSEGSENQNGGRECGGLIGQLNNISKITNCWYNGKMTTDTYSGGIIGNVLGVAELHMDNCLFSGTIKGRREEGTQLHIGGLFGHIGGSKDNVKKVTIKDCMSSGKITGMDKATRVGSVVGYINGYREPEISNLYATNECYQQQGYAPFPGLHGNKLVTAQLLPEDQYEGYNACKLTLLNFDKYWVAMSDATPELKKFATGNKLNTNGVVKAVISWYDKAKDNYTISDLGDLMGLMLLARAENFEGKNFKLANDIVLNTGNSSEWGENKPETTWIPIGQTKTFEGKFDGQGHTISGLYANGNMSGLFGKVGEGVTIQNLEIANSYFTGEYQIGGIAGKGSGTYSNIYIHKDVILVAQKAKGSTNANGGRECGGIIGQADKDTVMTNCWFAGQITADSYSGGLIGNFNKVAATLKIDNCLFSGTITGRMDGKVNKIGGFAGNVAASGETPKTTSLVVSNSLSAGEIKGVDKSVHVGSAFGVIGKERVYEITRTYVTEECYKQQGTVAFSGVHNSKQISAVKKYPKAELINYGACKVTLLDFDKYWAAKAEDTPELKRFSEGLSLEDVVTADISWYNEQKNNYIISDAGDLMGLTLLSKDDNFEGKNFKLANDIVLNTGNSSDWGENKPETTWIPIGQTNTFKGNFDGQGHTISGLYSKGDISGFFGRVGEGVTIKNLEIANSYFTGEYQIGGIAGKGSGTYSNIYVHEDVILVAEKAEGSTNANGGRECGGIIGQADNDTAMTNCWFAGQITIDTYSGGLIGNFNKVNASLTVENCLVTGTIEGRRNTGSDINIVGGFVGNIAGIKTNADTETSVMITNSLNAGSVTGMEKAIRVGSIFGEISEYRKYEINATYATNESYRQQGTVPFAGICGGKQIVGVQTYAADLLSGTGGYQYTTLDFEEYWVAIENKTPELKKFSTGTSLSVAGKVRVDLSWYGSGMANEYTLMDEGDLLGFACLAQTNTFSGKTINLGADITLNKGNAADWADNAPDIEWTPVGKEGKAFQGNFNGNGHIISGVYCDVSNGGTGVGFFGYCAGGVIENFRLENSCFKAAENNVGSISGRGYGTFKQIYSNTYVVNNTGAEGYHTGGIIGHVDGTTTIESCWFDGEVNVTNVRRVAGIAGGVSGNTTVSHCLNTGAIKSNVYEIAGMFGYVNNKSLTISDSLNLGAVTTTHTGGVTSGRIVANGTNKSTTPYTNVYGVEVDLEGRTKDIADEFVFTVEQLTGTAAQTNANGLDWGNYWYVVRNNKPILKCFASMAAESPIDTSWYGDGSAVTYEISTEAQLNGLGELAKTYDFAGKDIILTADIVMNTGKAEDWISTSPQKTWIPIGKEGKPFQGDFNGNGHIISGIYCNASNSGAGVGFFGYCAGGVIEKFRLENSCFKATENNVGSISGRGYGTFKQIYSNACVVNNTSAESYHTGGIMGHVDGTTTIESCWFDGEVNVTNVRRAAGIAGGVSGNTIVSHCLNTGAVKSNTYQVAGMFGYVNNKSLTISDSLNLGEVTSTLSGGVTSGRIVANGTNKSATPYTNVYGIEVYLEGRTADITDEYLVTKEGLKGNGAHTINLDYTTYWAIRQEDTPIPACFAESAK